jgi:hypothetical protein
MPAYDPRPQPNLTLVQDIANFRKELLWLAGAQTDSMELWRLSIIQNEDDNAINKKKQIYMSFSRKEKNIRGKLTKAYAERSRRALRREFD